MTTDEIKEKLASKKSTDRLRAVKKISKEKISELANELFEAYLKERKDLRTWEPQSEMIKALGILDHKPAFKYVEEIVRKNIPHDMITINASIAFVQLKRTSIFDAKPVLELLSFGSTSVICGALEALAEDKMLPPKNEIEEILKISWDINKHKDRIGHEYGLIDPRYYLAIACAGWDKTLCTDFLNHCIETAYNISRFDKPVENTSLINVCKKSLKGKYSNL
ncbi:hypothetical protein [Flavobacterium sp.]|uniref:hypothetical protein n=1 Tax=Flavobacterium sp. TaxID=239 RepID=UPI0031D64D7A